MHSIEKPKKRRFTCGLFVITILLFFAYANKPHPLSAFIAQEIKTLKLSGFEPVSITSKISEFYNGDEEKLFLDVASISESSFFSDSVECSCRILSMEFPVGFVGYKFLAAPLVRFVFGIEKGTISFRDAVVISPII